MKKLLTEQVTKILFRRKILLLSEYRGSLCSLNCKCLVCSYFWQPLYSNIQQGYGCPNCARINQSFSEDYVRKILLEKNMILLSEYVSNSVEIKCKCITCNNVWSTKFDKIKNRNQGCPSRFCVINKKINTNIKNIGVSNPLQDKKIFSRVNNNSNYSFRFVHWKTGQELSGSYSYEKAVIGMLNGTKEDYVWQIRFDMPNGKKYFIDLYLPERNLYIEIKGYKRPKNMVKWEWFHKEYPNSELWDREKLKSLGIL